MIKYNLFKDAAKIQNVTSCLFDTNKGFSTLFPENGDVNGWDIYSNICLYGSWGAVLFGTSLDRSCYISRQDVIVPFKASDFYTFKLVMKLTLPEGIKTKPTTGKLMWWTTNDNTWNDDKSVEFDLSITDQWHTYLINVGTKQYWQGDICNFRIFPFIDGREDIVFTIKSIEFLSIDKFKCTNTQCSKYSEFYHPCPFIGTRASVTSEAVNGPFSFTHMVDDDLIVNIDGYGDEIVRLGDCVNLSGSEMARIVSDRISSVSIGQYSYAEVTYDTSVNTFTLYSGVAIDNGVIKVSGKSAKKLGFTGNYTTILGESPATGFDYFASHRLVGYEINKLMDSNLTEVAYSHNPNQYTVEAGRRDYTDSMSSSHSPRYLDIDYYKTVSANFSLVIDASHPVNDCGRLTYIVANGTISNTDSRFVLVRPLKDGTAKIINYVSLPTNNSNYIYTTKPVTYQVDIDWLVNKGDLIGFYNFDVLCPYSLKTGRANAVYFKVAGFPSGEFNLGVQQAQGLIGVSFYARSSRLQKNIALDIDLGKRLDISQVSVFGEEFTTNFEYNVAACLDTNWVVDCHNETHWHVAGYKPGGIPDRKVFHRNKPYGVSCLSDCIRSADNGKEGDYGVSNFMGGSVRYDGTSYIMDDDPDTYSGFVTVGEHSYCYVNGDSEWLNGAQGKAEFYGSWVGSEEKDYEFDPISYVLIFPNNRKVKIHKTGIYFKETNNFKHLSLSYFLGPHGAIGNAEEKHYQYVPSFNRIVIDGVTLYEGQADGALDGEKYDKVYFSNPWPMAVLEYENGQAINQDVYLTVINDRMNVILHEFDSVECYGFKIHTGWHKSTKLTELEVYSSVLLKPSLLDNVSLSISDYNEDWFEVVFSDGSSETEIVAPIPGSPRYFKLELESQELFNLFEITGDVTNNELKSLDCSNKVAIKNAKRNSIVYTNFEIENSNTRPLNLYVDIPSELVNTSKALSSIRCNSIDTTINADFGPGAIIRKNKDYPLTLEQGQIANNVPGYALVNLIEDKKVYSKLANNDWIFLTTSKSNESLAINNEPSYKIYNYYFEPVSSTYWRLITNDTTQHTIVGLRAFSKEGLLIEIDKIFIQGANLNSSTYLPATVNEDGTLSDAVIFPGKLDNVINTWKISSISNKNLLKENEHFIQPILGGFGSVNLNKQLLSGLMSFDFSMSFRFTLPNRLSLKLSFLDGEGKELLVMSLVGLGANKKARISIYSPIDINQEIRAKTRGFAIPMSFLNSEITLSEYDLVFSVNKRLNTLTKLNLSYLSGTSILNLTNEITFLDRVSNVNICFSNLSEVMYYDETDNVSISYLKLTSPVLLSAYESITFKLLSSQPIASLEILKNNLDLTSLGVYINNKSDNNYKCLASTTSVFNRVDYLNKKVMSSEGYNSSSNPQWSLCWNPFIVTSDSDYTFYYDAALNHWLIYDFGFNNQTSISRVYFKTWSNSTYPRDHYKICYLYGSNNYATSFDVTSGYNVFITSFNLYYYNTTPTYTDVSFDNSFKYRYYIFYVKSTDGLTHDFQIDTIRLYTKFTAVPKSYITYNVGTFTKQIAIDLGKAHSLDIIRNYGSLPNLIDLRDFSYLDFSSSNTTDINLVNWKELKPIVLLLFSSLTDSSDNSFPITVIGDVMASTSASTVLPNGYGVFSGGYLKVAIDSNVNFYNNNFTIDFRIIRSNYGEEGLVEISTGVAKSSVFKVYINEANHLQVVFYSGNNEFLLNPKTFLFTNTVYHIAIERNNTYLVLYLNGKLEVAIPILQTVYFNNVVTDLIIGRSSSVSFIGKIYEFRIINNYCVWEYSFVPPSAPYSNDVSGKQTKARWIKISLPCGDSTTRVIDKLGIYPDISVSCMPDGTYNCEWKLIGNLLSNYSDTQTNLAPRSSLVNTQFLAYDFEEKIIPNEWSSGEISLLTNITQTTFSSEIFPDTLWSGLNNQSNFNVSHSNNKLVFNLSSSSNGTYTLNTHEFTNDCSCEISFNHSLNFFGVDSLITSLSISNLSNTKTIHIKRVINSSSCSLVHYDNTTSIKSVNLNGTNIKQITKFKITRTGRLITLSYFNSVSNVWANLSTQYAVNEYETGSVYFSFSVYKSNTSPSSTIELNYTRCTDLTNTSIESTNCLVSTLSTSSLLYCNSLSSVCQEIISLFPNILSIGREIASFSAILNFNNMSSGFCFINANNEPIVGVGFYVDKVLMLGSDGYQVEESPFTVSQDIHIQVVFDWVNSFYNITMSTETEIASYSIPFKTTYGIIGIEFLPVYGYEFEANEVDFYIDNVVFELPKIYLYNWTPVKCIEGTPEAEGVDECWCFPATEPKPTLILDLGDNYYVKQFNLYHTPTYDETRWLNNDYDISIATTVSGSFTNVVSIVDNTDNIAEHTLLTPVECRLVKLEINRYTKPSNPVQLTTNNLSGTSYVFVDGGFLREFEVISAGPVFSGGKQYISSEEYPVVCIDLLDNYNITGHYLVGGDPVYEKTAWDNDEEYFKYSSYTLSDPSKVAFTSPSYDNVVFSLSNSTLSNAFDKSITLGTSIFIPAGRYTLGVDFYNTHVVGCLELKLDGVVSVSAFSTKIASSSWYSQVNTIDITDTGYYNIVVETNELVEHQWGVSNVYLKTIDSASRWIAVTRNTATNFAWKDLIENGINILAGVDVLERIKVYTSDKLPITYNYWWWESGLSKLSAEKYNLKEGSRALRVSYPASDKVDFFSFMPGDSFGKDDLFSIKDALCFWLFVSDVSKLDKSIGGVAFGNFTEFKDIPNISGNRSSLAYYGWDWLSIELETGWNKVILKFDTFDKIYPLSNELSVRVSPDLNFRNYITSSLGFIFRGFNSEFYFILDSPKILRNYYLDIVSNNLPGLCLTWGEYLEIPLSGVNISRGSIHFDTKLYSTSAGKDHFGSVKSRTLFTIVTNNNETLALSIRGTDWFEVGFGNTKSEYMSVYMNPRVYDLTSVLFDIDDVVTIDMVWDNTGDSLPENSTVRLFLNGVLSFVSYIPWEVKDYKTAILRMGGGNTYLANYDDADGSAVFSNINYYNYCRTDSDLTNLSINKGYKNHPNDYLRLSKDGINYYDYTSQELPFKFEKVLPSETVKIYVEIDKSNMSNLDSLTGSVDVEWEVPI